MRASPIVGKPNYRLPNRGVGDQRVELALLGRSARSLFLWTSVRDRRLNVDDSGWTRTS
jgi:hypothetical protein